MTLCRVSSAIDEVKMKKRYITAAILLVLAMLLCGCSKGNKFEASGGKYIDKKSGVVYNAAPACYEPITVGEELYGTLGKVELFKIEGAAPERLLCEANGTVFYSDDTELPSLGKMNIAYAEVMLEDTVLVKITDSDIISSIAAVYEGGEDVGRPYVATAEEYLINWRIRFADEELGIYYILSYVEVAEAHIAEGDDGSEINAGTKFIFNRFEGNRCVAAGDVMDKYVAEFKELSVTE